MSLQNVSLYEGMVFLWDRKINGSTITGKYSCRKIFEDDLRCYQDIFVHIIKMSRRCDYNFLCDARIQEYLSEGERGGGPTAEKQPQQHYF